VSVTVKGYVGEDGDPDGGGTITPHEINVSVPTQVMWAAFQTDAGTVTAPNYHIKNNSLTNDVEVTLLSFTAQSSADNTAVDSALTLNLTGTEMATAGIFTTGTGYTNVAPYGTDLVKTTQWDFSFTGNWTGTFVAGNNYNPLYTMTFKFDEV
jgi:hypothetical protein